MVRIAALVWSLSFMATGCTPAEPGATRNTDVGAVVFSEQVETAIAAGASEAQLDILRDALAAGDLTLDQVNVAVEATFRCFDDNGIGHSSLKPLTYQGLDRVTYTFLDIPGLDPEVSLRIADDCIYSESFFVEELYVAQPRSREIYDHYFTENIRVPLIVCLRSIGIPVDDNVSNDEVWQTATDKLIEISAPYARGELEGHPSGCLEDVILGADGT